MEPWTFYTLVPALAPHSSTESITLVADTSAQFGSPRLGIVIILMQLLLVWGMVVCVTLLASRGLHNIEKWNPQHQRRIRAFSKLFSYVIILLGVGASLVIFHLQSVFYAAIASAGAITLAVGFATKDLINNFMSGVVMLFDAPFAPGDTVATAGLIGRVEQITLRSTRLRDKDGATRIVPNSNIVNETIANLTMCPQRRVMFTVQVASWDDHLTFSKICGKIFSETAYIIPVEGPSVAVERIEAETITLVAQCLVEVEHIWETIDTVGNLIVETCHDHNIVLKLFQRQPHQG